MYILCDYHCGTKFCDSIFAVVDTKEIIRGGGGVRWPFLCADFLLQKYLNSSPVTN